jgi:predicted Zn-dependent peptidase
LFGVYAATSADKLAELSDVVVCELTKICENVSDEELKRTKAQFRASLLMANESNSVSCEQIVNQVLIFNKIISRDEILRKINQITVDDVRKTAAKIMSSNASVATVGKSDSKPVFDALYRYGMK